MNHDSKSLRNRVRHYKTRMSDFQSALSNRPDEWGRYQSEFNQEVNELFRDIMLFEKEGLKNGDEDGVYKLKNLFIRKFRKDFLYGEYIVWSLKKPFGYAGDYKIIENIYENSPKTIGFERLYDNYFLHSTISIAVRNRKDDFKKILSNFLTAKSSEVAVMDLGCGPIREVVELARENPELFNRSFFDFYDSDENALNFASQQLGRQSKVAFVKENVIRFALKKDISAAVGKKFDLIYSTGLFDYFDDCVVVRLVKNLRQLLKPGGILAISDVRDKFSNPSVHFMEWVGDWSLIYRDDDTFRNLFIEAGFSAKDLKIDYEKQGVLQYILATNRD